MREAVGGTWLLYFFFIFIFIYVAFIAIIMNYASAYRTNNYIVSAVENHEGWDDTNKIKADVRNLYGYTGDIRYCCIENSSNGVVYRVQTYINFELPLISTEFKIPITTDSKTIYGPDAYCNPNDVC